jgi:hypothetical protein
MNKQPFSVIADEIIASSVLSPLVSAYIGGTFPLFIEGAEGSLHALIIGFVHRKIMEQLIWNE